MGDAKSSKPVIKPLNTHATSSPVDASVASVLGTDGEIRTLNTHATGTPAGDAAATTDNTHATGEPAN